MGSLKNFLQSRNEENVLEKSILHMKKVLECVVEFERGCSIYIQEKKPDLAFEIFKRVDILEHEADIIRRDLLVQISKSELSPQLREDLTHLVKRIDRIANTTDGAARRLTGIIPKHVQSLGDDILAGMGKLVQQSVSATKILFNLIKNLPDIEDKELFTITEQIQKIEHSCDVIHSNIYDLLNKIPEISFNHFVAIQI
ncbi:MAG: DUF47 domain-containing protein, partial [Promethearchaeota archaeon]